MKKYQMSLGVLITAIILLSGFKENPGQQNILSKTLAGSSEHVSPFAELPKVNIADLIAVKGITGDTPVEVMVYLSHTASEPVSMKYTTKNRSAIVGVDYVAASGTLTFEPGETAKKINVFLIADVAAEADEEATIFSEITFELILSELRNAILENGTANITVIKDIARDPRFTRGNQSVYEVAIIFTGYTSLGVTAEECGVRSNGIVILTGLLAGSEKLASDEDVSYRGTLQMIMGIDICSMKRLGNDEDKLCGIRVNGSGTVYTELEIYHGIDSVGKFDGRGGYIKIENKDGRFRRTVEGECDDAQIDEEWTMVPNKSIASVFNGKDLPMLVSRTLQKGEYVDTDPEGNKTVVKVLRKIR